MQRTLVEQARDGDTDAFESLVRASSVRLLGIASRILRDRELAEDALQTALIAIWDELPRLRDPDRFDAWSYRLITRISVALAKHERRGGPVVRLLPSDVDSSLHPLAGAAGSPIDAVADRDRLERGFARLKPDQRAILVLHYYAGLSLAEIAEALEIPPGTVASRLHYAMRALRAALDADDRIMERRGQTA